MRWILSTILLAGLAAPPTQAQQASHEGYFEHYEGTKTCLQCHREEAEQFFHSQHYQWQGLAPHVVNAGGKKLGKLNTINDFCTNPQANWIGVVTNSKGRKLTKGCSSCHPGFGKLPSTELSEAQLENMDCLICHGSGYRRDLYGSGEAGWEWKPILWKNQEGMDAISKRISLPERVMCLRCHANSGGGPNYKRGDLEYALVDAQPDFDVHMAKSWLDMQCVDCHRGEDHRVRGKGTDLSGFDMPGEPLSCDNQDCHGPAPHKAEIVNHHAKRVYCTVCHVPTFAKEDPTDMVRDWSSPVHDEKNDRWSANITLEKDVEPAYTWYNGTIWEQLPGLEVKRLKDGTVGIVVPQGSKEDPDSRIFAFKLHRGRLPVLKQRNWIIPIVVEEFFADGDLKKAIKGAAKELYEVDNADFDWVDTVRYMGIFHEVQPAAQALDCLSCHQEGGRMDWKALGYGEDPMLTLVHRAH